MVYYMSFYKKRVLDTYADSKGSDQPAHLCNIIIFTLMVVVVVVLLYVNGKHLW